MLSVYGSQGTNTKNGIIVIYTTDSVILCCMDSSFRGTLSKELRRHFASHRCGPSSIPGLGRGRMCEKFHQLLTVRRWFPPGTPVSSTRKLISSSSFHRLDMTLVVAEALNHCVNLFLVDLVFSYFTV